MAEQNTVKALKSELCECKQDNERLLKSLDDVQKEVLQLRYGTAFVIRSPLAPRLSPHLLLKNKWKLHSSHHIFLGNEVTEPWCHDLCVVLSRCWAKVPSSHGFRTGKWD